MHAFFGIDDFICIYCVTVNTSLPSLSKYIEGLAYDRNTFFLTISFILSKLTIFLYGLLNRITALQSGFPEPSVG